MAESKSIQDSAHKLNFSIIFICLAGILLIVICGASLYQAVVNNVWSLNFEHYAMRQIASLQPAPAQHLRAKLWLARDALAHHDPARAQALVTVMANNGDKEALVVLGDAQAAQGQFGAAVIAWSQAGAYTSLNSAATEAKNAGRLDDALQALRAAYALDPEVGTLPLGTFLLDSKTDPAAAGAILQKSIQQYPFSAQRGDWYCLMGRVDSKEKQSAQADSWFARAISVDPNQQIYWLSWANAARDGGKLTRALDLYSRAAQQFPDSAPIYYEMAWAYKLTGSNSDAVQSIQKALQLASPATVWYEIRAGQIYTSAGLLKEALKAYQSAQTIDKNIGTAYLVSFYRYSLNDPAGAASVLKSAIAVTPDGPQLTTWRLLLAGIDMDASSWQDAKSVYAQILAQDPKNVDALIGLGRVDYAAGDGFTAAQSEFQKAIDADPQRGDGYYAIAHALVSEKRYAEADDWFVQAIARSQDSSGWWVERGNAARSAGNLSAAIEIYTQALQRFQNFASGYYELAWAYRMDNNKSDSIQAIEAALAMTSSPSEWYYVRAGQIYAWAGLQEKAIAAFHTALQINPANSSAQQGLTQLGQ